MSATEQRTDPDVRRHERRKQLRATARRVREYETKLDDAVHERDRLLIDSHGPRRDGGLSYEEMAEAVGVSRGRIIQIVQGVSDYSRAQLAKRRRARA